MKTKHITLHRPDANSVFIAGSFNDWSPDATPLGKNGGGAWTVEIALPAGRHEYRFVVDGEWVDDPQAAEVVPNAHGGVNAVLVSE
jgi:1,4-alpha-glucan branching enzyme